jgi:hypothetical protein
MFPSIEYERSIGLGSNRTASETVSNTPPSTFVRPSPIFPYLAIHYANFAKRDLSNRQVPILCKYPTVVFVLRSEKIPRMVCLFPTYVCNKWSKMAPKGPCSSSSKNIPLAPITTQISYMWGEKVLSMASWGAVAAMPNCRVAEKLRLLGSTVRHATGRIG